MIEDTQQLLPPQDDDKIITPVTSDHAELIRFLCAMGTSMTLQAGEYLCHAGDFSSELWLLQEGALDVHMHGYDDMDALLSERDSLLLVGEIGLFTHQRRSADIIATKASKLICIAASAIEYVASIDAKFKRRLDDLLCDRWLMPVLSQHDIFNHIHQIDRARLCKAFVTQDIAAGETLIPLHQECDGLYLLQRGCIFFTHQDDVDQQASNQNCPNGLFPGDMVHMGGLLRGYESEYQVVTATACKLLHLSRENFDPFVKSRAWLFQSLIKFVKKPSHLQLMHPDDDYMWLTDRHVHL